MEINPEKELARIRQLSQALYKGLLEGEVKDDGTRLTGEIITLLSNKNFYRDEYFKLLEELEQERVIAKNSVSRQAWESVQAEVERLRIAAEEYRSLWHGKMKTELMYNPDIVCAKCLHRISWTEEKGYTCLNPNCEHNF